MIVVIPTFILVVVAMSMVMNTEEKSISPLLRPQDEKDKESSQFASSHFPPSRNHEKVVDIDNRFTDLTGNQGGAWTAETHLSSYGFNADWGLMEYLESSCRDIENSRIPEGEAKWTQYRHEDPLHRLNGWWKSPKPAYINCRVLEIGCGVGVYVDMFKKERSKKKRKVFGIEPNPMGGTFNRGNQGPEQLAIDILSYDGDITQLAKSIRDEKLGGAYFDLIYSIEVFEHLPLDRHEDGVRFMAALARDGTKLVFGAAKKGQDGIGHIGPRSRSSYEEIMARHKFIKDDEETGKATGMMQEFNHRQNTNVYYYVDKTEGKTFTAAVA